MLAVVLAQRPNESTPAETDQSKEEEEEAREQTNMFSNHITDTKIDLGNNPFVSHGRKRERRVK